MQCVVILYFGIFIAYIYAICIKLQFFFDKHYCYSLRALKRGPYLMSLQSKKKRMTVLCIHIEIRTDELSVVDNHLNL